MNPAGTSSCQPQGRPATQQAGVFLSRRPVAAPPSRGGSPKDGFLPSGRKTDLVGAPWRPWRDPGQAQALPRPATPTIPAWAPLAIGSQLSVIDGFLTGKTGFTGSGALDCPPRLAYPCRCRWPRSGLGEGREESGPGWQRERTGWGIARLDGIIGAALLGGRREFEAEPKGYGRPGKPAP